MMRYAFLLLASCATVGPQLKPCKTTCGVRLFGSNDCEGFQEWEDRSLKEYSSHVENACDKLFGWVVYVQPGTLDGTWHTEKGRHVSGLSSCRTETIYIGTDDWRFSSYSHELIHAFECPTLVTPHEHEEWYAGWEESALKKVRGW